VLGELRRPPTRLDIRDTTPMTILRRRRFDGRTTCPQPIKTTRRACRRCPWIRRRRRRAGAAGRGSRSKLGSLSALRRCRTADERDTSAFLPANDLPAHNDEDGQQRAYQEHRGCLAQERDGHREAGGGVIEWIEQHMPTSSTRFDGSKRRAAKIGIDRCAEGS